MFEFGTLQSTIGCEGAKLLQIGLLGFDGWHPIALRPEKTLSAQSPDVVLNGVFEDRKGRWKQGEMSLGTKPTCGLVLVMPVPPKQGLSYTF